MWLYFFPRLKNLIFFLLEHFMNFYEMHVKYTTDTFCPTFKYSVMVLLNMHELRHGFQIGDETE